MLNNRYNAGMHQLLVETMAKVGEYRTLCRHIGITEVTLRKWRKEHPQLQRDLDGAKLDFHRDLSAKASSLADKLLELYHQDPAAVPPIVANNALQRAVDGWGVKRVEHTGEFDLNHWLAVKDEEVADDGSG